MTLRKARHNRMTIVNSYTKNKGSSENKIIPKSVFSWINACYKIHLAQETAGNDVSTGRLEQHGTIGWQLLMDIQKIRALVRIKLYQKARFHRSMLVRRYILLKKQPNCIVAFSQRVDVVFGQLVEQNWSGMIKWLFVIVHSRH